MTPALDTGEWLGKSIILGLYLETPKSRSKSPNRSNAPKYAIRSDQFIVSLAQHLRAKSVFDTLVQQPGEGHAEKTVSKDIEESHGTVFHALDETDPIPLGIGGATRMLASAS